MTAEYREIWSAFAQEAETFVDSIRELPVTPRAELEEVRREVEASFDLDRPLPLAEAARRASRLLRRYTVHVTHPRYFGLFNPSVREAGVLGDALAALYNPQLAAWSHAPAAAEMERLVLHRLARALGLPSPVEASFTTGGAEANLTAVLAALAARHPEWSTGGLAALELPPVLYVSAEGHHSFVKIARLTGLGTDAVHTVPPDGRLAMDPAELARIMAADAAAGREPLLVVGTAGTTSAGVVDPLPRLADAAAAAGAWFHVDAAWGGAAALSARLRPALAGIERADSITWDAHKWLSVPMAAGMFFCRHPEAVRRAFAVSTSYMPSADVLDPYVVTVQWSRRFIGLKVLLALAELGLGGYGALVERQAEMGELLRARLSAAGWILVNETPLPVVCFTHPDLRAGRATPAEVAGEVQRRGRAWISEVVLAGRERALRACITSFRTEPGDVEVLVEELETALGATRAVPPQDDGA